MANKPNIRFKGFTDDWEQRKLGDCIIEFNEVTTINNQYPALTSSRKGIFLQTDYFSGKQIASDDNTGYNIVPYGYFTYRHMSDDEIFYFNINDIVENGIVSTLYPVFTTTNNLDSRYLQYQLNNGYEFAQFAILQKQGGSRTYMYLNKLKKMYLTVPTTIEEQKMISKYMLELDHLITLHQRKCDETKKLKKFMLQKMFPKNGENNPEIRFAGFTDDWEQRKLGDSLLLLKDGTHGTHADANEGPLLLSAKNIKDGTIKWDDTDRRISLEEYEKIHSKFNLKSGDVLLTIVGSIGETAILQDSESLTFQRSVAFLRPQNDITSEFLYSEIQSEHFQKELESRKSTSAQPGIYLGDLAEIPLYFPSVIDEQKKIGQYFSTLDHLITLHQRKCDKLKLIKKFMLQNMFPKKG